MPVKLRLTGRESFTSPLTYGVSLNRLQVILVRDADAPPLQALMNRDADPDVAVFTTLVGAEPVNFDLTNRVNEEYLGDGSLVIHPTKIAGLPYSLPKGLMLRDGQYLPYGFADGAGGYVPMVLNYNIGGAGGISDLVARASQQVFTVAGTYPLTPPAGATMLFLSLCGGAGGGGSGRRGAAATARSGGSGGGAPATIRMMVPKEDWAGALELFIGAGGSGGAAVTVNDTSGNNGLSGSSSALRIGGATYVKANAGNAGVGGTAAAVASSGQAYWDAPASGSSLTNVTAAAAQQFGNGTSPAGCSGGSISAADAVLGYQTTGAVPGYTPTVLSTTSGAAGVGVRRGNIFFAVAGNGGAAATSVNADAGGAGIYGSGGGGGGASLNGFNSGAGGRGGDGWAIVIWR